MDTLAKVSQCGLCKVDLKGRFVFVDEEIVKLLGASPEELFGRPLMEFLHEDSQKLFEHFLYKRNNYESVYETTELQLVTADNKIQTSTAIISLNFVGGNPVNIQIILVPSRDTETTSNIDEHNSDQESFANELFQLASKSDLKTALDVIRQFTKAQYAILYMSNDKQLEPRSVSADDEDSERVHQIANELQDIHYEIATQAGQHHFHKTDNNCEYLLNIGAGFGNDWLLRVVVEDDSSAADFLQDRAKVAGQILTQWLSIQSRAADENASGEQSTSLDIRFAVGLLDVLRIGAIITDQTGQVVGFNPSLSDMLQDEGEDLDLNQLAHLLAGDDNPTLLKKLTDAFVLGEGGELKDYDLMLPSGGIGRLRIVRLGDSPDDLQACIVIVPSFVSVRDFIPNADENAGEDILTDILSKLPI